MTQFNNSVLYNINKIYIYLYISYLSIYVYVNVEYYQFLQIHFVVLILKQCLNLKYI